MDSIKEKGTSPAWQADAERIISLDLYGERPQELVDEIGGILSRYSDEQVRIQIASYIAPRHGRRVSEYFDLFQISNENSKVQIARAAATDHARRTSWHFQTYQIESEGDRFIVAQDAAFSNGLGLSEFIHNYDLPSIDHRVEVLRTALVNDSGTLEHFHRYFPEYGVTPIKANPSVEDIAAWLSENQPRIAEFLPTSVSTLYSDMKRRDAGTKLLAGYLGRTTEGQPVVANSRDALERLTGFPATWLREQGNSSNTLGDLYEILTDLQSKYHGQSFERIKLSAEVVNTGDLSPLLEFASNFNLISQLMGNDAEEYYGQLVSEVNSFLDVETASELAVNTENLPRITTFLKQRFLDLFNSRIDWGTDFTLGPAQLNQLVETWEDINPILTLAARYNGRSTWKQQLPVLAQVTEHMLNNTFTEFKYEGAGNELGLTQLEEQIGFLAPEQQLAWQQNPTTMSLARIEDPTDSQAPLEVQGAISSILVSLESDPIDLTPEALGEIQEGFAQGDKQLQKALKRAFGNDTAAMVQACIQHISALNFPDAIRIAVSRVKSLKDLLQTPQHVKVQLDQVSAALSTKRNIPERLVFTTIFDDPKLMMSAGNLVRSSSCMNYNNGSEAPAILAGVIDANIKGLASFVIGPSEDMTANRFQALLRDLNQQSADVTTQFLAAKRALLITTKNGEHIIRLGTALHRRYLKVGRTSDGQVGIRMEKPAQQGHLLTDFIEQQVQQLYSMFAATMGASTDEPVYIPPTRNPGGSYSDVAVGHQAGGYVL